MSTQEKMNIAFATDDNYVMATVVAMTSLLENNPEPIEIYLLSIKGHLNAESKDSLKTAVERYQQSIRFIDIDIESLEGLPILSFGLSCYLRLLAPKLLPEINKLLYMDADILVNGSIAELYHTDLAEYHAAGVADIISIWEHYKPTIGFNHDRPYINSGILLMNLKLLRELDIKAEITRWMERYYDVTKFPDQDFINCVFPKICIVHPKYNAIPIFWKNEKLHKMNIWSNTEIAETIKSPIVVHFTSHRKPWRPICTHSYKGRWKYYLKKTHYKGISNNYPLWQPHKLIPNKIHALIKLLKDNATRRKYRQFLKD